MLQAVTRVAAAIVVACAVVFAVSCWVRVVTADYVSTMHELRHLDEHGRVVERSEAWRGCHDVSPTRTYDHGFPGVAVGDGLLIACTLPGDRDGYALLDPAAGTVQMRWPLMIRRNGTVAVLPGADRSLAIVFETSGALAVAIAGPDGWLTAPRLLPAHQRFEAAAWNRGALEIVTSGDAFDSVLVHRLTAGGTTTRTLRADFVIDEVSFDPSAGWLVWSPDDFEHLTYLAENGERVELALPVDHDSSDEIDGILQGSVRAPWSSPKHVYRLRGRHRELVAPERYASSWTVADSAMRTITFDPEPARTPVWTSPAREIATRLGDRDIVLASRDRLLWAGGDSIPMHPIARGWLAGPLVVDGGLIKVVRVRGVFYVVSFRVGVATLDDRLQRVDQRSLLDHIRTPWSELERSNGNLGRLAWVLLGLPLALGLAALLRRRIRRGPVATWLAAGAIVYLLSAAWTFFGSLVPLLA